ncbi:hypothetical protein Q3G72_020716 [Acer saccharum]|nr:hypothetical protein Q3G72_020716 [Acer saccharum]
MLAMGQAIPGLAWLWSEQARLGLSDQTHFAITILGPVSQHEMPDNENPTDKNKLKVLYKLEIPCSTLQGR